MTSVLGWDIGAANIKAAWICIEQEHVISQPFEIWREKERLSEKLILAAQAVSGSSAPEVMAVTMTAELSDVFATKREGVRYVIDCLKTSFPSAECFLLSLSGEFAALADALTHPLDFAASNWLATALWVSRNYPDCLTIDVGSTTTDIIPIVSGRVSAAGWTDLERLSSGELVYTGALRTNLTAIVHAVPVLGKFCRVASEYFAVSGDVHMILDHLQPHEYTCSTPDGRIPSIESARSRLARIVCADDEMLSVSVTNDIASYIYNRQIDQIREGIAEVISRHPRLRNGPAVVLGSGKFLARAAAEASELRVIESDVSPCLAAAHLLAENLYTAKEKLRRR